MTLTSTDLDTWFLGLDPFPLLSRAFHRGGAYTDLYVEDSLRRAVRLEGGEIARAGKERERGYAIRLLSKSGSTRHATSTSIHGPNALELASEVASSFDAKNEAHPLLAHPERFEVRRTPARIRPESVALERLIELAKLGDRIARGVSNEVKEVTVFVRDVVRSTAMASSDGGLSAAEHVRALCAVEVIAESEGVLQSSFEATGGLGGLELIEDEAIERTARSAAERAVRMVHAAPAPVGEMPVVLAAEAGGTFVHEAVGHSLEADLVIDGLSLLGDRALGERVANEKITVIDDATLANRNGSFLVDDEGTPAGRTMLIARGVLVSLLHDRRTALILGASPNGKGRRESFRHRPIVRMSNTMIAPGGDDPRSILRDTDRGLYVVRMGGGEVDTVTGQFVFEVNEAYRIEHGEMGEPVRGATFAGDALEVLESIDRVGSDLGFGIGTCGKDGQDVPVADAEPTLRVPSLVVGGGG
jgi:TldD protein